MNQPYDLLSLHLIVSLPPQTSRLTSLQQAKELAWLLVSLQETLAELKSGLEDCYALLAPIEPGSTLVLSSPRSESIKGHVTRVGCGLVKGVCLLSTHPLVTPHYICTFTLTLPSLTTLGSTLHQRARLTTTSKSISDSKPTPQQPSHSTHPTTQHSPYNH